MFAIRIIAYGIMMWMHIIKYILPSDGIVLVQKCVISKGFYDVIIKKENSFITYSNGHKSAT